MNRCAAQNGITCSEAIRRLIELGLKAAPVAKGMR
jgi:hypothetical protein